MNEALWRLCLSRSYLKVASDLTRASLIGAMNIGHSSTRFEPSLPGGCVVLDMGMGPQCLACFRPLPAGAINERNFRPPDEISLNANASALLDGTWTRGTFDCAGCRASAIRRDPHSQMLSRPALALHLAPCIYCPRTGGGLGVRSPPRPDEEAQWRTKNHRLANCGDPVRCGSTKDL